MIGLFTSMIVADSRNRWSALESRACTLQVRTHGAAWPPVVNQMRAAEAERSVTTLTAQGQRRCP